MFQFIGDIGDINDTKVAGLESLLNYMSENYYSKDEPAVNAHHYHITKKQYKEETHNIYNVGKSKSCKKPYHNFSGTQFNTKSN